MADIATEKFIIRRTSDQEEFRSICGFKQALITADDTGTASVSRLRISDSRMHYHKKLTEFYYVLDGKGAMILDGEEHALGPGDIVMIKPGVRHTSKGDLEVLIFGVPPLDMNDVFFD